MAQPGVVQMEIAARWKRTKAEIASRRAVHRQFKGTSPRFQDESLEMSGRNLDQVRERVNRGFEDRSQVLSLET